MNICIIGYGKMGNEIEKIALKRNHNIPLIIDISNQADFDLLNKKNIDVAIEFSTPASAEKNILKCFEYNIPVVSGTTGWNDQLKVVIELCKTQNKSFFYASNFSIGVNIFFHINSYVSKLMQNFPDYKINIHEIHHIHKKDAPSGTAITLANEIINNREDYKDWTNKQESPEKIFISSERTGEVPGTHYVNYISDGDKIQLMHEAKSRTGFATGAVLAAEFLKNKQGFYTMKDLLKF
ncbi:MAG: 4-hydroxy-tetrahydrodipicolinate reductase [Marinilabiliales bacterium]